MREVLLVLALLVLVLVLLLIWCIRSFEAWRRSSTAHARSKRAIRGEKMALSLLAKEGYRIIDKQVPMDWTMLCDGQEEHFSLRLDVLVEREGKEYVAEVKTGECAPSLRTAATRRQLLEYALAHGSNEILLVDVESKRISKVEFVIQPKPAHRDPISSLLQPIPIESHWLTQHEALF